MLFTSLLCLSVVVVYYTDCLSCCLLILQTAECVLPGVRQLLHYTVLVLHNTHRHQLFIYIQ